MTVRFGAGFFATDQTVLPEELGRMVEERGFDVALPHRAHAHPGRPLALPGGGELPEWYKRTLDPFVALAAIAAGDDAAAARLRHLAGRRSATRSSPPRPSRRWTGCRGGRVDFGVGAGWNEPGGSRTTARRSTAASRSCASTSRRCGRCGPQEEASFDGEFVSFDARVVVAEAGPGPAAGATSAATGRACSTASSATATTGCRTVERRARASASPSCARAPRSRAPAARRRLLRRPAAARGGRAPAGGRRRRVPVHDPHRPARSRRGLPRPRRRGRRDVPVTPTRRERASPRRASPGWRPRGRTSSRSASPLDGDVIWSAVDAKPKRTRALRRLREHRRDPRVAVLVDEYDDADWSRLWWARADGVARVVESAPRPSRSSCARYPQYAADPPAGPFIASPWTAGRAGPRPSRAGYSLSAASRPAACSHSSRAMIARQR